MCFKSSKTSHQLTTFKQKSNFTYSVYEFGKWKWLHSNLWKNFKFDKVQVEDYY